MGKIQVAKLHCLHPLKYIFFIKIKKKIKSNDLTVYFKIIVGS